MKLIIIVVFLSVTWAKPLLQSNSPEIITYETERDASGGYKFFYQTSDDQQREEHGIIKNGGTDNEVLSVKGFYTFLSTDGVEYTITYTADENGFQPVITQSRRLSLPAALLGSLIGSGIR
ncbi:Adult cuticle protein 65Aa [Carabus blaptoides fortunei]